MNDSFIFINVFADIIISLFAIYLLKTFFNMFFEKRERNVTSTVVWIFYYLWQFTASRVNLLPVEINFSIIILFTILICVIAYNGKIIKKIIFSITFNVITIIVETLCWYLFLAAGIYIQNLQHLSSILTNGMLFLIIILLKKVLKNERIQKLSSDYNIFLLTIPIGSIFVISNTFRLCDKIDTKLEVVGAIGVSIIMFIINIVIFAIYKKLTPELELKRCNTIYEQQLELCNHHLQEKDLEMKEYRQAKHDMQNKCITLFELAKEEEYQKIIELSKELFQVFETKHLGICHTGNTIVDSLINYKYSVASRKQIDFSIDVKIPMQLPFRSGDLCIILGNALDNALEAVDRIEGENRYIKIEMKFEMSSLFIYIRNSFDGMLKLDDDGNLKTRKIDEKNHGIGMVSIRKATERYQGIVKIRNKEKEFILKALLYEPKEVLHMQRYRQKNEV